MGYQGELRNPPNTHNVATKKKDMAECQRMEAIMRRLEEWAAECFRNGKNITKAKDRSYTCFRMGGEAGLSGDLRQIREQARLTKLIWEEPEIETRTNQEYTDQDIDGELRHLANRKAHGADGLPGEAYKESMTWAARPTTRITNDLKMAKIPDAWTNGAILYIGWRFLNLVNQLLAQQRPRGYQPYRAP